MAGETDGEDRFRWAVKSAAQGERDGFCYLGYCYRDGFGCEVDVERAKENYLVAAELGHVYAMIRVGKSQRRSAANCLAWKSCFKWRVFLFLERI